MRRRIWLVVAVLGIVLLAAAPAGAAANPSLLTPASEFGSGEFGASVAISADGSVIVAGAPGDSSGRGAAWVFERSGAAWHQVEKLRGAGERGDGAFGTSVAISGDATTILVGAPADGGSAGAAWAFVRSGSRWLPQGPKLTGAGELPSPALFSIPATSGEFGAAVALSGNGDEALIGAPLDSCQACGAVWSFARTGSTWSRQGPKFAPNNEVLTGSGVIPAGSGFGSSIALSASGTTAVIGNPNSAPSAGGGPNGGAWIFENSGSGWTQAAGPLSDTGSCCLGRWGSSVGISADGTVAFVGSRVGLSLEYAAQPSGWLGTGDPFPLGAGGSSFATAVTALAGDGRVVLLAGAGSALPAELLVPQGTGWTVARQAVAAPSAGTVTSAALSSTGSIAVLGAPAVGGFRGSVVVDQFTASGLLPGRSSADRDRGRLARRVARRRLNGFLVQVHAAAHQ